MCSKQKYLKSSDYDRNKTSFQKFGDFVAVEDLTLSIGQGELFSLLGLNGVGKTTTIKMLSCLILPSSGNATLLNKDLVKESQYIKQRINVSPQETAIAPNLNVQENLELMAGIYGISKEEILHKVDEMVTIFNLSPGFDTYFIYKF
ncbi:MAG: ATP-binding cassette domain-containing protein [Bacteroidales bacterium]